MLSSDTLDEVKKISIADLMADAGISLKKQGQELVGLCPFHKDSHPSMNVNPDKGVYICRACGAAGDSIKFMREFYRLDFMQAVEAIAQVGNIPLEFDTPQRQQEFEQRRTLEQGILNALGIANVYFAYLLKNSMSAQKYLKKRGMLDNALIREWEIGYSGDGMNLLDHLISNGVNRDVAIAAATGLMVVDDSGTIRPKFRNRIMIPINNARGQCIGFTGRTISSDVKPKYLNSPASPVFDKKRILFALDKAAKSGESSVVVVEGHMDAIALHRIGYNNTVATQGTAISEFHLRELGKRFDVAILALDSDEAGLKATRRTIELANGLPGLELQLQVAEFSSDPDELIQQGQEQVVREAIAHPADAYQWLVQRSLKGIDVSPRSSAQAIQDALAVVAIASPTIQEQLLGQVAYNTCPSPLQYEDHLEALRQQLSRAPKPTIKTRQQPEHQGNAVERAIATVIAGAWHYGGLDGFSCPAEYDAAFILANSNAPPDEVLDAAGVLQNVLAPMMAGDGVPEMESVWAALAFLEVGTIKEKIEELMVLWMNESDGAKRQQLAEQVKELREKL